MELERRLSVIPSAELVVLVLDGSGSMKSSDFHDPEVGRVTRGQGVANMFNYILERLARSSVGDRFFISTAIFATKATVWEAFGHSDRPYYPWALVRKELRAHTREAGITDVKSWLASKNLLIKATYELATSLGLGGSTNIADGFRKAKIVCDKFFSDNWDILPPANKRRATVIMLTDGMANEEVDKTLDMADELKKMSVRIVTVGISEETARLDECKKLLYDCATPADLELLSQEVGEGTLVKELLYRPSGSPEHRLTMILERIDRSEDIEALRRFLWTVSGGRAERRLR